MPRGRPPSPNILTPREWEVLALLREGLTNEQIARRLGISYDGAKFHVSQILSKLNVGSRREAAAWAGESGGRRSVLGLAVAMLPGKAVLVRAGFGAGAAAVAGLVVLFAVALNPRSEPVTGPLGKVAFIRDGDLWSQALPSGTATRLTTHGAAARPQWSPSGEWLLYQQGPPAPPEEIGMRVIRADGSGERRLDGGGTWSPSGDVLALTLEDSTLVLENADGSGRRELLPPVAGRGFNPLDRRLRPQWSSDGQWVVFLEHHADHTRAAAYTYIGVRAVRADGSDERELFSAAISPDGLLDGPMPASWQTASGGAPAFLTLAPRSQTAPEDAGALPLNLMALVTRSAEEAGVPMLAYSDFLSRSPDGRQLAIVAGVELQTYPVDPGSRPVPPVDGQSRKAIVLMDLATGATRQLSDAGQVAVSPSWSPDGGVIVYVARPDVGPIAITRSRAAFEAPRRLWTMAADGSSSRQLETLGANCRQERPQWSADGEQVLFACVDGEAGASLWLVPSTGGAAIQVVAEVSPEAQAARTLFTGYQGHIEWAYLYDWWREE